MMSHLSNDLFLMYIEILEKTYWDTDIILLKINFTSLIEI